MTRYVLAALLFPLGGAQEANSAQIASWFYRGWLVGSYTDDQTGNFSHCAASRVAPAGAYIIFATNRNYLVTLGFAHPKWTLAAGASISITVDIDSTRMELKTAAINPNQAVSAPGNEIDLRKVMSAKKITARAFGFAFEFPVDDIDFAVGSLPGCVAREIEAETKTKAKP